SILEKTLTRWPVFVDHFRYGEDNEEQEEGLRCIAVPVFDRFGVVIAGLSISFPTLRFSEERLQEYVAMLHTAARKISAQMGYHDYPF
ncbi:hypothetical protein FSG19_021485, partial [Escherichia coli]|nr:hypothetical protein [Escherichia coli]